MSDKSVKEKIVDIISSNWIPGKFDKSADAILSVMGSEWLSTNST